jgi:hypothetical protein
MNDAAAELRVGHSHSHGHSHSTALLLPAAALQASCWLHYCAAAVPAMAENLLAEGFAA